MAQPSDWSGANLTILPPEGYEHCIQPLRVFHSGRLTVSCWELSVDELMEIISTRKIYIGMLTRRVPAMIVGIEDHVRDNCVDWGKVWTKEKV